MESLPGRRGVSLLIVCLLMLWPCTVARAADGEAGVLQVLAASPEFMKVLRRRAPVDAVAADGAIGKNRTRYAHAAVQRDAIWLVLRALTERNLQALDAAITAFEYGFERQTADGNFENGVGASARSAVGADAFFLQAYCRTVLLLDASGDAPRVRDRLLAMNKRLPLALSWLKANRQELVRQDRKATNRLFFDALAFGLCGKIAGDSAAIDIARDFVRLGLANQRSDGSFDEHGGFDSSYQAVTLLNIAGLLGYLPRGTEADQLRDALKSGAEWELTRIDEDSGVTAEGNARTGVGREGDKLINYYEVALALFYTGYLLEDTRFTNAGVHVSNFILENKH